MMKNTLIISICILVLKLASCARIGSPDGGSKDSIPPVMAFAKPFNKTTSFDAKKVTILFDEYIKFSNLSSQLIISPPMEQKPDIMPTSGVSKKITIEFLEELKVNTTYTINFGNSIVDNNEGNELGRFSYVFSTGPELDSLSITASVLDPLAESEIEGISLMAYKNASDTLVGHYTPNYLTNTLKTNRASLENLSEATYKVIALEDKNNNYKYDKGLERIGFIDESIDLKTPVDSLNFTLFLENKDAKIFRPTQANGGQVILGFNGKTQPNIRIEGIPETNYMVSKESDKDSLNLWFKEIPTDSILLFAEIDTIKTQFTLNLRNAKKDSISVSSSISGTLHPRDTVALFTTIPVDFINNDSIALLEKDSIAIPFNFVLDKENQKLTLDFKRKIKESYSLILKKHAFTDFLGFKSKPQKITFKTLDPEEYGEIVLDIENEQNINLIVDLLDSKKDKITKMIHKSGKISFKNLVPEKYTVRITKDTNDNKMYDNGNFAERIQPEEVLNFTKEMTLRANSEINEKITVE